MRRIIYIVLVVAIVQQLVLPMPQAMAVTGAAQQINQADSPSVVAKPTGFDIDVQCAPRSTKVYLPAVFKDALRQLELLFSPNDALAATLSDQVVPLGSTFIYRVVAHISGSIVYAVSPLPLPKNATFDAATGKFVFIPESDQVGKFTLAFTASNGAQSETSTLTINVPQPNTADDTALCGRVLDANAAAIGIEKPVNGATIKHLQSGRTVQSAANGYFKFTGLPAGAQQFEYDGSTASGPAPGDVYGAYRGDQQLIANVINEVSRPVYIMKIDAASRKSVNPSAITSLVNPTAGVTMTIPANTVKDGDGGYYAGLISVSQVPQGFTPASLPSTLNPAQIVTIQPMGLTFAQPVPITFENKEGLPPGSEVDIWSMDHASSEFFVAGKGRITADGKRIETISGGVREASWHFPMPPKIDGADPGDGSGDNQKPCPSVSTASLVNLREGCVETGIELPTYTSQGGLHGLRFIYSSGRAYPRPLLPFEGSIPARSPLPKHMSYSIMSAGGVRNTTPTYINTSNLSEGTDESIRGVADLDFSTASTGVYPYTVRLTNHFDQSTISTDFRGNLAVVNDKDSIFGAGFGLAGLQRLHIQPNGNVLCVDGSGADLIFRSSNSVFPQDANNLALFEFNDDTRDLSGNNRHATLLGGSYANTLLGRGLKIERSDPVGIDWSAFASLMQHPYSVEFILTPENTQSWAKLFSHSDSADGGWYYKNQGIQDYPNAVIGSGEIKPNELHYLAFVSTSSNRVDVYFQGRFLGSTPTSFTAPPVEAIFFRDERNTGRGEQFEGTIDALRISKIARSPLEIAQVQKNIENGDVATRFEGFASPRGDYSSLGLRSDGTYVRRMKDGTEYRFNTAGYQTALVDPNGNTTTYGYDTDNRLITITDPVGKVTSLAYQNGKLHTVTDPVGRVSTFEHDAAGNLTRVTLPDGASRQFGYDARHLLTTETDERGQTSTHVYDKWGHLVSAVLPMGVTRYASTSQSVGLVDTSTGLGTINNPAPVSRPGDAKTIMTDGEGRKTIYTMSPVNTIGSVGSAAGFTQTFQRDKDGNATQTQLPSGAIYLSTFDERGNQLTSRDQTLNAQNSFAYESTFNKLASVTDPFDQKTSFDYDDKGNLIRIRTPLSRSISFSYSAQGLLNNSVDTLGTATTLTYDGNGNPTQVNIGSGPDQRSSSLSYTPAGYVQSITDPLGRVSSFAYDAMGRVTTENLPDSRLVGYQYDAAGNLISLTPPGKPAHRFEYNDLGLLSAYVPPTVTGSGNTRTTYEYNKAQQLTHVVRPDGKQIGYAYDFGGRLFTISEPRGNMTLTYSTSSGQLSAITSPDGVGLAYSYNGDLLTALTWSGPIAGTVAFAYDGNYRHTSDTVNGNTVNYSYDADGGLTNAGSLSLVYSATTGLLNTTALGSVNDSRSYNAFGELTGYSAKYGNAPLYAINHTHDKLGRIVGKTETISGTTTTYAYAYDAAGRLAEVQQNGSVVASYTYDANGNRLTGTYDDQDRLLQYGNITYVYTANGELQSATTNGQTTNYSYDTTGNLVAVGKPDGTQITYLIDGQNRRVGKKVNGVVAQGFLYASQLRPIAELDNNGAVVARFVYGTKINVPEYMVKGGATYRLITDHLGSVRLVVNIANGTIAQRIDYDAWGKVLLDTQPGFQPFGFAGGLYDAQTGLVRFGARDYDAEVGRWTSKDPILFGGLDPNLFLYSFDSPVTMQDFFGLVAWPITLANDATRDSESSGLNRGDGRNGLDNAYKHCLGSCMMAFENGQLLAQLLGWGNEIQQNIVDNQETGSRQMDDYNNSCGRSFASQVKNTDQCRQQCLNAANSGQLKTYQKGTTMGFWKQLEDKIINQILDLWWP